MFGLTSYDGKLDIAYFYADTIAELANLPNLTANGKGNLYTINAVGVGSKCDCYEDKNVYILKGDNTWQIFKPIESSGGDGSSYTLPTASTTTLGGVKIDGTTIIIDDGIISATNSGSQYTLPTASTSVLGGVKVGTNLSISNDGVLSATDTVYTLPEASTNTLGGVKVDGSSITINNGVISATGGGSGSSVKIVSWSNGTDAEIAAMLDAHYRGEIDIYAYWKVGDERIIHLNAMENWGEDSFGESHVAQDVKMVLMHKGGKTLVTPINGHTECAFIVGQKNILCNGSTAENGPMDKTYPIQGWPDSQRRTWCNTIYKNAFPSTLIGIFKEHQNLTGKKNLSSASSNDYFALPSAKELNFNLTSNNIYPENANEIFDYYNSSSNSSHTTANYRRIKCANENKYSGDSINSIYWTRTTIPTNDNYYKVTGDGAINTSGSYTITTSYGLAPFGVI